VFYNTLRLIDESKPLAMHGYKDHMEAEGLLRLLQTMDKLDLAWKPTARKLKSALDKHIAEEENEIFQKARELFTETDAIAMAKTFKAMKSEIQAEGLMGTTLDMLANLMPPRFSDKFRKYDAVPKQ
jgi:5-formyltetrahydrofolate cyclo-ligase